MLFKPTRTSTARWLVVAWLFLAWARWTTAQVGPAEIVNPRLKSVEAAYLPQLKTLNHDISSLKFPFPFQLGRYVGIDPVERVATDARGLEFVYFQNQLLLKISGNYNAAFNSGQLTQNERASRTFTDVIVPVLQLVTREIPADVACDGIGFEIAYHVRSQSRNYDYEGREILVVVLNRPDAFAFLGAANADRQGILNRSQVYLNGRDFGLALGEKDPLNVEALARSVPREPAPVPVSAAEAANTRARLKVSQPSLLSEPSRTNVQPGRPQPGVAPESGRPAEPSSAAGLPESAAIKDPSAPAASAADVERLESQHKSELDALAKIGAEKFHFVDYAPPSFAVFRNRVVLQITMRNTLHFAKDSTSIYKRAAQSFDLFLAPQLKDLVSQISPDVAFDSVDISILNQLSTEPHASSEAIEFVLPLKVLHRFVDADITNQQLLDESVVLVNGVRIALNLQLVE